MKLKINSFKAVAMWKWDTSAEPHQPYRYTAKGANWMDEDEDDEEVCGICRLAFENCCPECKLPGDDCPLIWGECTHVFHMHCLLKWTATEASKGQCPMDRRVWETADRKPDRLPTTVSGGPVESIAPGPIALEGGEDSAMYEGEETGDGGQTAFRAG